MSCDFKNCSLVPNQRAGHFCFFSVLSFSAEQYMKNHFVFTGLSSLLSYFKPYKISLAKRREQLLVVEELPFAARAPRSLKFGLMWLSGHLQRNPIVTVCCDLSFMLRCWKENLFTEICFLYDFERSYILFLTLTVLQSLQSLIFKVETFNFLSLFKNTHMHTQQNSWGFLVQGPLK